MPSDAHDDSSLMIRSLSECTSDVSEELGSEIESEDLDNVLDCLVTTQGEAIADVMAGIRDALDKMNKILYNKLQ